MHTQQLTARFPTGEEMNAALADLRRSGAVCHTGAIPYDGMGPSPVLRFSVREADLGSQVRCRETGLPPLIGEVAKTKFLTEGFLCNRAIPQPPLHKGAFFIS